MIDREKTSLGIREMIMRDTWRDIDIDRSRYQRVLNDALTLLKEQNAEIWQLRLALKIASGKGFHYTVSSANVGDVIIETKAEKPEEGRRS